jgi:hypothetical protein
MSIEPVCQSVFTEASSENRAVDKAMQLPPSFYLPARLLPDCGFTGLSLIETRKQPANIPGFKKDHHF